MNTNEQNRIKIQSDVAKYLASGGTIDRVDHTANHGYRQPKKRNRKEQIAYRKRVNKVVT